MSQDNRMAQDAGSQISNTDSNFRPGKFGGTTHKTMDNFS